MLTATQFVVWACLAQSLMLQNIPSSPPAKSQTRAPLTSPADISDASVQLFESRIRPALIAHCYECHSSETEASGGLLLDSKSGLARGGDSGVAIIAHDTESSLLIRAIRYEEAGLEMPPDGKLDASLIRDFETWVQLGALDPRVESANDEPNSNDAPTGLPVERAQEHWAYRPIDSHKLKMKAEQLAIRFPQLNSPIDRFLMAKLKETASEIDSIHAEFSPEAEPSVLVRRLAYDLTGLPPTSEHLEQTNKLFSKPSASGWTQTIEQFLDSQAYGEHFARHWMDVTRYADSITLRGFVFPEAWRYRDYLIRSFNGDVPFDQMIAQQIAGDLMDTEGISLPGLQDNCIATTMLVMGNTNLEQQDKAQLEMDFTDEQLEVVGRAFMAQTLGCARCHDHKFDPIPTQDYYALAGIFQSALSFEHENVSKWIERNLPIDKEQEAEFERLLADAASVKDQLENLQKNLPRKGESIPVDQLAGVVVDSQDAERVGSWVVSTHVPAIGGDYLHDANQNQGKKTLTFAPSNLEPGNYAVRFAYTASSNRATNVKVLVASEDGEKEFIINQRQTPPEPFNLMKLGEFRFAEGGLCYVRVSNEGADGHVIADAVQFLPVGESSVVLSNYASVSKEQREEVERLESELKRLEAQISKRPKYMTVAPNLPSRDIEIRIRGDVHRKRELAKRGFLTAISATVSPEEWKAESKNAKPTRLDFANWIASPSHPLTSRVYVNRVWTWVMGQPLVATVNNFGTTGETPSHPELLDWLANEFTSHGWSTKHLVKLICQSEAYRRQTASPSIPNHEQETAAALDPGNYYWTRHPLKRLSVESLKDAMLMISGELDPTMYGSEIPSGLKEDYRFEHTSLRRSIYAPVFRNSLPPLNELFDFADPNVSTGRRIRSTVTPQILALRNHPWVIERSKATARRWLDEVGISRQTVLQDFSTGETDGKDAGHPQQNGSAKIRLAKLATIAFEQCFARSPSQAEQEAAVEFFAQDASNLEERTALFAQALFASVDFQWLE